MMRTMTWFEKIWRLTNELQVRRRSEDWRRSFRMLIPHWKRWRLRMMTKMISLTMIIKLWRKKATHQFRLESLMIRSTELRKSLGMMMKILRNMIKLRKMKRPDWKLNSNLKRSHSSHKLNLKRKSKSWVLIFLNDSRYDYMEGLLCPKMSLRKKQDGFGTSFQSTLSLTKLIITNLKTEFIKSLKLSERTNLMFPSLLFTDDTYSSLNFSLTMFGKSMSLINNGITSSSKNES